MIVVTATMLIMTAIPVQDVVLGIFPIIDLLRVMEVIMAAIAMLVVHWVSTP